MAAYRSWQPGLNVVVGDFMEPANVLAFGFQCTFAGLTGTEEPDWSTAVTAGDTITDGAVTWTAVTAVTIEWTAENLSQTGSSEPVWSTTVDGTTGEGVRLLWTTRTPQITDEACPHSAIAFAMASKVFSPYKDVVKYCATNAPRDWSTVDDAGFLPCGMQGLGSAAVTAIGEYRGRMAVFTASDGQLWTVDPDPAEMALFDQWRGIGVIYPDSVASVGNEMFFVAGDTGIRTLSVAVGATNIETNDVGAPVDPLVQEYIDAGEFTPHGTYYPGLGQLWMAWGDDVLVYTSSRLGRMGSWSRYSLGNGGIQVVATTQDDGRLFIRDQADRVIEVDREVFSDLGGFLFGYVQTPYLTFDQPGRTTTLYSIDLVGVGSPSLEVGYLETSTGTVTDTYDVPANTTTGNRVPVVAAGASMDFRLLYGPSEQWELAYLDVEVSGSRGNP